METDHQIELVIDKMKTESKIDPISKFRISQNSLYTPLVQSKGEIQLLDQINCPCRERTQEGTHL